MTAKYQLYGDQPRCLWCGEEGKTNYKEITFKEARKDAEPEQVLVCSDECEKSLLETERSFEGKLPLFFLGVILGIAIAIVGGSLVAVDRNFLEFTAAGILVLGITLAFFPFVTPQTVQWLGMRKGYLLGRVAGIGLAIVGVGMAIGFAV